MRYPVEKLLQNVELEPVIIQTFNQRNIKTNGERKHWIKHKLSGTMGVTLILGRVEEDLLLTSGFMIGCFLHLRGLFGDMPGE